MNMVVIEPAGTVMYVTIEGLNWYHNRYVDGEAPKLIVRMDWRVKLWRGSIKPVNVGVNVSFTDAVKARWITRSVALKNAFILCKRADMDWIVEVDVLYKTQNCLIEFLKQIQLLT